MAAVITKILNESMLSPIGWIKLGYSTGTTFYTDVRGKIAFVGTDGATETNKAVPISNIDAQKPVFIFGNNETNAAKRDGRILLWTFDGAIIVTDNITTGDLPTVGAAVYLQDDGSFGATDTDSAGLKHGICIVSPDDYAAAAYRCIICKCDFLS